MSGTVLDHVTSARAALLNAARSEEFEPIHRRLERQGLDDARLASIVGRVSHGPRDQDEILAVRRHVRGNDDEDAAASFERYALLCAAQTSVTAVPALPVPDEVKHLLLDEYTWMAQPRERELRWFAAGDYVFSAMCKLATLRRFPAGQMHWEVAGLPRSALWKVRPRHLPHLLRGIVDLGGFRPTIVPHLAWRRKQIVLSEREHYRSLARMAGALELQSQLRGFVAFAWFYSPDTERASPHLAWAHRLFIDWGGTVVVCGAAGPESGVFEGSRRRQSLAEEGTFRPTIGLAIWPRAEMIAWAENFRSSQHSDRPADANTRFDDIAPPGGGPPRTT